MARCIPAARGHADGEDRQVHAVQAVQELAQVHPFHPGEEARPPQAGWPLVGRPQLRERRRRIWQLGAPCLPGPLPLWTMPQDVDLVLMRRPAMGACRVGLHNVAGHAHRRPQGPRHEAA